MTQDITGRIGSFDGQTVGTHRAIEDGMNNTSIRFLDTNKKVEVETPVSLSISWGDRVSRYQNGPIVYGSLAGASYGTADDLYVSAGQRGHWWEKNKVSVYAKVNGYAADITDAQRAAVVATYEAVAAAWRAAVESDPEIAGVVEAYRVRQDQISSSHVESSQQWDIDVPHIAKLFRRRSVSVEKQTVPGRCCVRSCRGRLLGYAHVRDGQWIGTVEKL